MTSSSNTIFALSSGALPSGVAVVRISGGESRRVAEALAGSLPAPRHASLRTLRTREGAVLDSGLVLFFPAGNSFTGEDCVEFQLHGGKAVIAALFRELADVHGIRAADAGEFTRRAFDNGRLDLVEIEGLADLLTAETEMQRRLAIDQSSGRQSRLYQDWLQRLSRLRALIEAELDFPDEDDVPGAMSESLWGDIKLLHDEIARHTAGAGTAEIIRDGFRVVIAGRPNAGKSSLLNALAKRDVAIVTAVAGTTRDIIGVDVALEGYLVHFMDTAGLRETDDLVEREGVERAVSAASVADLVILLREGADPEPFPELGLSVPVITVQSKADLLVTASQAALADLSISTQTMQGIDSLTKRITAIVSSQGNQSSFGPARRRQQQLLGDAKAEIDTLLEHRNWPLEVRAESLRRASHALEKLVGRVDVEDLLGLIFSEFCIGK